MLIPDSAKWKKYSQNDEDGIIDYLVQNTPNIAKSAVEIGWAPHENNTSALAEKGWSVLAYDRQHTGDFVTLDNVGLFVGWEPLGLLSIDVDGNDAYLLDRALFSRRGIRPISILCCEYNHSYGMTAAKIQEYDPESRWDKSMNFGASVTALDNLCSGYGYILVHINGVNAFWVRNETYRRLLLG